MNNIRISVNDLFDLVNDLIDLGNDLIVLVTYNLLFFVVVDGTRVCGRLQETAHRTDRFGLLLGEVHFRGSLRGQIPLQHLQHGPAGHQKAPDLAVATDTGMYIPRPSKSLLY